MAEAVVVDLETPFAIAVLISEFSDLFVSLMLCIGSLQDRRRAQTTQLIVVLDAGAFVMKER